MPDQPRGRVLVLDDDTRTLDLFCEVLRRARFEVVGAATMAAALAALRWNAPPVAVIVAELQRPDAAGVDVLAALRNAAPHSRIIVLSGFVTAELRAYARDFGVVTVLEKPVPVQQLVQAVAAAASDPASEAGA